MEERLNKRLNSETSVNDVNGDVYHKITLDQTQKELPLDPINVVVDEAEEFNNERQSSTCYRFISTVVANVHNTLFDNDSWVKLQSFKNVNNATGGATLTNEEAYAQFLEEEQGWFGYKTPEIVTGSDAPCSFYDFNPKRESLYLLDNTGNPNWTLKITRPVRKIIPAGSIVDGGLLIVDSSVITVGGRQILILTTPVKHNLKLGSLVQVNNFATPSFDGQYKVIKLGDIVGDDAEYQFGIDATATPPNITTNTRIKRLVGGKASEYYFREFDVVDSSLFVDQYNLPMAKQVYNDNVYQAAFDDVSVEGLVDHLNRPVTELFVTITKTSGNGFTNIKSGLNIPYIPNMDNANYVNIPDIHRINEGPNTYAALETNILPTTTTYLGDVVDYNEYEVTETVLADVHHSFNRTGRLTGGVFGNRYEGYFYKAHYRIPVRDFSNYVEQGDSSTDGIPTYAIDLGDGRFLWRDILDIGFNDGQDETLDYPFTNGCHYIHNTVCLNLHRQDPFSLYGSYYATAPADAIGVLYETTDFETKNDNTNC